MKNIRPIDIFIGLVVFPLLMTALLGGITVACALIDTCYQVEMAR